MSELPNIYGFNKASEIGPDILAPCIFLKGCNLRCPYCMNAKLVKDCNLEPIDLEIVKKYVLEEKSQWVLISGGEPTLTSINALCELVNELRSWGCKVGMSTNGTNPDILTVLLPLLNYVALDFKTIRNDDIEVVPLDRVYTISVLTSLVRLMETKLNNKDFDFEIRTTLYPHFINEDTIRQIGSTLRKDTTWMLQQFRHSEEMLSEKAYDVNPYTNEEVNGIIKIAKEYSCNVRLRYV